MSNDHLPLKRAETVSAQRRFRDPDGRDWAVREEPAPAFDRRASPCLIFDSIDIVRRVRDFPRNWIECSDLELHRICNRS